jgi:hypothetical protein
VPSAVLWRCCDQPRAAGSAKHVGQRAIEACDAGELKIGGQPRAEAVGDLGDAAPRIVSPEGKPSDRPLELAELSRVGELRRPGEALMEVEPEPRSGRKSIDPKLLRQGHGASNLAETADV